MINVKQYLLFGFMEYYPAGGAEDFVQAFDTVEAAKEFVGKQNPNSYKGYNIMDLFTLTVVFTGVCTYTPLDCGEE